MNVFNFIQGIVNIHCPTDDMEPLILEDDKLWKERENLFRILPIGYCF